MAEAGLTGAGAGAGDAAQERRARGRGAWLRPFRRSRNVPRMVEYTPGLDLFCHALLILGVLTVALPLWLAFTASTHEGRALMSGVVPLLPGDRFLENYTLVLGEGLSRAGAPPIWLMMTNSAIMAVGITGAKIALSLLSAFAIVYFRFPLRGLAFWTIFVTLMLPVEVRILPTFEVVAGLGLLNSYTGLILPLVASATATFLFRQTFLTMPDELTEAARMDGAGALRFFWHILLPLSRTNIAALSIILFVYGWNQYLWPLLVTTDEGYYTVVMGLQRLSAGVSERPQWHLVTATAILALLPPVVVIATLQRLFVKGLVETEK